MSSEHLKLPLPEPMKKIEEILKEHIPFDEKEKKDILLISQLMGVSPNLLSSKSKDGHFTGSALVVDNTSHRFLLHLHKKLGRWFQFGGHPESETDLSDVAMREATEETGLKDLQFYSSDSDIVPIDIDVHIIPEKKDEPAHPHLDFRYLLVTNTPEQIAVDNPNESNNFRWFSFNEIDEVSRLVDPALLRLILKSKTILESRNSK